MLLRRRKRIREWRCRAARPPGPNGEKRGELATRFAGGAGNKRDKLPSRRVREPRDPSERERDPAVLQHIDGDAGPAGGEFGIDAQVVVNACERALRERLRVAFDGMALA